MSASSNRRRPGRSGKQPDLKWPGAAALATTRLGPQDRGEGHVARQHLLARLDDVLAHRLTIVHAGAGYGKTSLLTQWLNNLKGRQIASAWLTLEDDEASPTNLLAHIIASLASLGYVDYESLPYPNLFDAEITDKSLATLLVNLTAQRSEQLVIFLDEYNRAQSEETNSLLRKLIRNLPHHVHLVISSRWQPDLDIENLRAHSELVEITSRDLRFSNDEVDALFLNSGINLGPDELRRLTDRTEGWPIALQVARLWLNGDREKVQMVSDFSGHTADLTRYLSEQVLVELPEEQRDFILQTAIVDRVNGELANAVTGRRDGWIVLEYLRNRNLFLSRDEGGWFQYHALFLDFLREQLQKNQADVIPILHQRAAEWLAGHGMVKQAVHHALNSNDENLAAVLLSNAGGWRMVMYGHLNMIRSAVTALPDSIVRAHPPLALAKVFLLVKDGDIKVAREYFDGLDEEARESWTERDRKEKRLLGHVLSDYADEAVTIEEIGHLEALRREIPKYDHLIHAILTDSIAAKYCEFGFISECLDACDDAIARYRILNSFYGEVFLRFTQAKAYLARGRLDEAEMILLRTEKEVGIRFGDDHELSADCSVYLAEILTERNSIEEAATRLQQALPIVEQCDGWYELYAAAYGAAASVAWARDGLDATLGVLDSARRMAVSRDLVRLNLLADSETVFYLCTAGRAPEALRYLPCLESAVRSSAGQATQRLVCTMVTRIAIVYIALERTLEADQLIASHIQTAEDSGDIRQLIAFALLTADSLAMAGKAHEAVLALDKAVRYGLFTGIKRTYLDYGQHLLPTIDLALREDNVLTPDRYRDIFLRELRRDLLGRQRHCTSKGVALTEAEEEVLRELDHGFSNKEIARRLGISPNTVKYRLKNLFSKLGVSIRSEAVRLSRERSLLHPAGVGNLKRRRRSACTSD